MIDPKKAMPLDTPEDLPDAEETGEMQGGEDE